jgi:deoxycytidylate deaminase
MADNETERKVLPKITPQKDDFFMGVLMIASAMCKDPTGQQASILVDRKDRWVAFGINFLTQPDTYQQKNKFGWDERDRELALVTNVEAVIHRALKLYVPGTTALEPFDGHILYTTGKPLLRDIRMAHANGVKDIIYGPVTSQYFDESDWHQAQELAKTYSMKLKAYNGNLNWLRDRVWSLSHLFCS